MKAPTLALTPTSADGAYMNPHQLRYFQELLLRRRDEIGRRLETSLHDDTVTDLPDWVDSASRSTQFELSWADRERSLQTIRQIDAALARIQAGTYGYCAETGEEIGLKRLTALPIARFCVEAQNEMERQLRVRC